jgi:hypothetical protein
MRWAPTVCLLSLVVGSPTASAQPLELRWQAPNECPDRAQVQARVEHLLERGAATSEWLAEARVARKGRRWILKLSLQHDGRRAARTLQGDDCVTLSDAAAWLIAVAIDPSVSAPGGSLASPTATSESGLTPGTTGPQVANDQTPVGAQAANSETAASAQVANSETPADAQVASSETPADEQPTRSDDTGLTAAFGGGVFGGMLATGFGGPAVSLGGQVELRLGRLWFGLLVAHAFERTSNLTSGAAAHFTSQELGLQFCLQFGAVLHLAPCVELAVRRTSAGTTASPGHDEGAFWATLGPGVQLTHDLSTQAEVFLNAGLFLPFTPRPQFELDRSGSVEPVGSAGKAGGAIRLGVGMHWQ